MCLYSYSRRCNIKIIEKTWELEYLHLGRPRGYSNFREESDLVAAGTMKSLWGEQKVGEVS